MGPVAFLTAIMFSHFVKWFTIFKINHFLIQPTPSLCHSLSANKSRFHLLLVCLTTDMHPPFHTHDISMEPVPTKGQCHAKVLNMLSRTSLCSCHTTSGHNVSGEITHQYSSVVISYQCSPSVNPHWTWVDTTFLNVPWPGPIHFILIRLFTTHDPPPASKFITLKCPLFSVMCTILWIPHGWASVLISFPGSPPCCTPIFLHYLQSMHFCQVL